LTQYLAVQGLLESLPVEISQQVEAVKSGCHKNQSSEMANLKIVEVIKEVEKLVEIEVPIERIVIEEKRIEVLFLLM
jgi:hypothetical protein